MVSIRTVSEADARRCHAVETAAFSAAAAASFEKISNRIANYPEGFLVLECDGQICGFINSGCADQVDLADEDFKGMTGHRSDAPHVVILSVAVDPTYHGRGFARMMMEAFVARMTGFGKRAIHLICRNITLVFMNGLVTAMSGRQIQITVEWRGMKWSWNCSRASSFLA